MLRARRLGWAGVELDHDGDTLLIDAIVETSYLRPLRGPDEPFPPPSGPATAALVTHLHSDHSDPGTIAAHLSKTGTVYRPEPAEGIGDDVKWTDRAERAFRDQGLSPRTLREWDEAVAGPYRIVAAPAVDGLGDPQRNWIVECDGIRVFHGGDTLFHGYWWLIARRHGPFDIVFLPINGVIVEYEHLQPPSPFAAAMTPEEAAVAAQILGARVAVPIHYGSLHKPPIYVETPDAVDRFRGKAAELGVSAEIWMPGDWMTIARKDRS